MKIFQRLTPAVLLLSLINLISYAMQCYMHENFGIELYESFSAYCHVSTEFRAYQLLSFMFTHDYDPTHVLGNLFFFLLFAPYFERIHGFRKTIFAYVVFGFTSYLVFDIGIDAAHFYILGSSGAVVGFCMYFFLSTCFQWRKIVFNLLVVLLIIDVVLLFLGDNSDLMTALGHLGGMIGGLIVFISEKKPIKSVLKGSIQRANES